MSCVTRNLKPSEAATSALKLDVGCGNLKREGFVGVDILDVADYQCDIANDSLPFPDNSADHIFSSHCIEHITPAKLAHVFQEFSRVCRDGALLELWHPFSQHRDAFIFDHKNFLNEEHYYHMTYRFPTHWEPILGARWVLEEVRFNVEPAIISDLSRRGVELDFAVQYLQSVVKELGAFIRVRKAPLSSEPPKFIRTICDGRRDHRYRVLGHGPYADSIRISATQFPALSMRQSVRSLARAAARRLGVSRR